MNEGKIMEDCKHHRNSTRARMVVYAFEVGYRVDEHGRAWSRTGRQMRPRPHRTGYYRISLRNQAGDQTAIAVHQLAAYQKFGAAALAHGVHVRHMDGNPLNNRPDNLELGTPRQNSLDRPRAQRVAHAKRAASFRRRLSAEQAAELRADYAGGMKLQDAATKHGIAKSTASYIVNGKTYR